MTDKSGSYARNLTSYGDPAFSRYMRRAFLSSMGLDETDLDRPIVGIADTSSDYVTCHRDMPGIVDAIRRGVLEAGGLPFVFPTTSLHEILMSPTTMLFRNLLAMETEEMILAHPMDAVVLVGGCDKTVPAQLMAAASANLPALIEVTGPMLTGHWRGERLGACTDCRRLWAAHRAGEVDETDVGEIETNLCPTGGTCMVMGTASTMACLAEALGMMLPGGASAPSPTGARLKHAARTGRAAVALAGSGVRPRDVLTSAAFANALVVLMAIGGSTNAIVHLAAVARRAGVPFSLDDVERASARTPLLVDAKPAGKGYMEDFDRAGGMPALLKTLEPLLDGSTQGADGVLLGERLAGFAAPANWQDTIRTLDAPLGPTGALVALHGSLAPGGAIIKAAAASKALLVHEGPAVVFDSPDDVARRIDDPALNITPNHILVLRNAGPVAAGMPEAGAIPIPRYLAREGVKDMVRVSDARMSGTAYGTIVLHAEPEAAVGGPLALVRDGDLIRLDVPARTIDWLVDPAVAAKRREEWRAPDKPARGYRRLYAERVLQASGGADFDFC